jgi:hypothetical protein
VLELAGVPLPPDQGQLDGRSLAGLIRGDERGREAPLGFWVIPAEGRMVSSTALLRAQSEGRGEALEVEPPSPRPPDDHEGLVAWIDGDYKLLGLYSPTGASVIRLFDLASDPAEEHDLAREQPERAARMRAALEDWQRSVVRSLNGEQL